MDVESRENAARVYSKVVCLHFTPQQWRKTKCKLCFHDIMDHTKNMTKQESEELIRTSMNLEETLTDIRLPINNEANIHIPTTKAETPDIIEPCYSPRSTYTTGSSKGSSDRLDEEETEEDTSSSKFGDHMKFSENENGDDESERRRNTLKGKVEYKILPSHFGYDQQDSIDIEEGSNSPRTIKRRARSYHKNSNLLQFSAMMRSSNSSLCSFTSEYTDGYSDYDYDIRSITDDTDDYTEVNDVIDELENIKPELKARVQNERRISRSKILDLERELEGQQDHYRASEVAKERQILAYQREIEGLKLELSSVKAHEHILALKSRLERESQATCINDLKQQVQSLQQHISSQQETYNITEYEQEADQTIRELELTKKKVLRLEEENTSFQEKINLAEDLQKNDRELSEFLRKQLSSLENDLVSARENNRLLEDNLKLMEVTCSDYVKEQEKCTKLTKELESIRQKVKRRDRHIEDLEDDNVKLQQLKTELESQLSKRDFKMKKMERRVSELQNEVTKCNKEIADLTGEKRTFEQVRKLTDLKLKDLQGNSADGVTSEVENGKNIFIHTLEERLRHSESRAKELQLENNAFLKDLREVCENLNNAEQESEEYKELLKECEKKCQKIKEECKHKEKKNEWLQRKLHKAEQEKKRAINRQNDAELKLVQHQEQYLSNTILMSDDSSIDENDTRMLKLKLQSTEAKLQMIEGNKGYLEKKVNSLERKVEDKEHEITRLLDSMERDSGAPSQDYDRFDVLERENVTLQSKLDQAALENMEQKQLVNQLEENNTHLEATIKNLNEKLDTCNIRLKELENCNHKLGREAFRRSQCFTGIQGREDESLNELRNHNTKLQERLEKYNDLEEEVKQLGGKVKKEKGNAQWYSEENEKLKIKIVKLSQNLQSLETSKKEFEKTIHNLQNTNTELDIEVKRLEEKLEIYSDLFGKDSKLSSSLRRRSYQSDEERDEERMIENYLAGLAPLVEEIKEKDCQIRALHDAMEKKNEHIDSLTSEIDLLEQNLAAMYTEKIKSMHLSGDSSGENDHSEGETASDSLLHINKRKVSDNEKRKLSSGDCNGYVSPATSLPRKNSSVEQGRKNSCIEQSRKNSGVEQARKNSSAEQARKNSSAEQPRKNSSVEQPGNISPELQSKVQAYLDKNDQVLEKDKNNETAAVENPEQELTVTTDVFYDILREHQEMMQQKDLEYHRKNRIYKTIEDAFSGTESPDDNKLYETIENALLDHYHEDGRLPSVPSLNYHENGRLPSLPSLNYHEDGRPPSLPPLSNSFSSLTNISNNDIQTTEEGASNFSKPVFVQDMYEQLAELESMVNIKYKSPQVSPKQTITIVMNSTVYDEHTKNHSENNSDNCENNGETSDTNANIVENIIIDNVDSAVDNVLVNVTDKVVIKAEIDCKTDDGLVVTSSFNSLSRENQNDEVLKCHQRKADATPSVEKGLDLSGLDELLAEVNKRGNDYQEQVVHKKQQLQERRSLPMTSSPKTASIVPSIRTTKRQIIRLKELNRSESFDAGKSYYRKSGPSSHSLSIVRSSVSSSLSSDSGSLTGPANNTGSTSSIASTGSQVSVIFAAHVENDSNDTQHSCDNNTPHSEQSCAGTLYRRPNIDVNKFLNSSSKQSF